MAKLIGGIGTLRTFVKLMAGGDVAVAQHGERAAGVVDRIGDDAVSGAEAVKVRPHGKGGSED